MIAVSAYTSSVLSRALPMRKADEAVDADPYLELAGRLLQAIADAMKESDRQRLRSHLWKGNECHEPAGSPEGGQFCGGGTAGGEKPTSTEAKGVKPAVRELLMSGHAFTVAELVKITGAPEKTVKLALYRVGKPNKWSGQQGALQIQQVGDKYQVIPGSKVLYYQGEGKPPAEGPGKPEGVGKPVAGTPGPSPSVPTSTSAISPSGQGKVVVPAQPMSKAEADKIYAATMKNANERLRALALYHKDYGGSVSSQNKAILDWKDDKAMAMAQWYSNVHGQDSVPAPQSIFAADKLLYMNLFMGKPIGESVAQWKNDTNAEKAGTLGNNYPAGAKPESVEKPAGAGKPLPMPENVELVPKDWQQITPQDVTSGAFRAGAQAVNQLFGHESIENKVAVEKALSEQLKGSPAFQTLVDRYSEHHNSQIASATRTLIAEWAHTSGDHNNVSIALQLSVRDAFGMKDNALSASIKEHIAGYSEKGIFADAGKQFGVNGSEMKAALTDFVRAQYAVTQDYLSKNGITAVYVTRGTKNGESGNAEIAKAKLQPMSSFSTDHRTATSFGQNILMVRVPASQVIGSCKTGFGCTIEREVVVLHHSSLKAIVYNRANGRSLSEAEKHIKYMSEHFGETTLKISA